MGGGGRSICSADRECVVQTGGFAGKDRRSQAAHRIKLWGQGARPRPGMNISRGGKHTRGVK